MKYLLLAVFSLSLSANAQPNIIFILADDLGYGDLSCYGSEEIQTPNLDALAASGVRMTRFYAAAAVCTPTRASILSGQYPFRLGITEHFAANSDDHLENTVLTLPKLLQSVGYYTAHVGKWHLGGLKYDDLKGRKEQRPTSLPGPNQHGFDFYASRVSDATAPDDSLYYWTAGNFLSVNDEVQPSIHGHYTDIITDYAIDALKEGLKRKQPVFLNVWHFAPHGPYNTTPQPFLSRSEGTSVEAPNEHYDMVNHVGDGDRYNAMVAHMDYNIGRLIKACEELGIADNTIIVFTSDNGPAYRGSTGGLDGGKGELFEGGIRVPCIFSWPGKIAASSVNRTISNTVDLLPTFCTMAGIGIDNLTIDGRSLTDDLIDGKHDLVKEQFWQMRFYPFNFRPGDKKLPEFNAAVTKWPYKMLLDTKGSLDSLEIVAVYNIVTDSMELDNLYQKPNYNRGLVKELYDIAFSIYTAKPSPFIREELTDKDWEVYPLIGSGRIHLVINSNINGKVGVYRTNGELVKEKDINPVDLHSFDILLPKFGVYLFVLNTETDRKVKKVFVY